MSKTDKQTSKLTDVTEVKAVSSETVNAEVKAVVQEESIQDASSKKAKATTSKKQAAKKETSKKDAAAKKSSKKVTEKAEKAEKVIVPQIIFQFLGNELDANAIAEEAKKAWIAEGHTEPIKSLAVYIKPEEAAAYYVINGEPAGKIQL